MEVPFNTTAQCLTLNNYYAFCETKKNNNNKKRETLLVVMLQFFWNFVFSHVPTIPSSYKPKGMVKSEVNWWFSHSSFSAYGRYFRNFCTYLRKFLYPSFERFPHFHTQDMAAILEGDTQITRESGTAVSKTQINVENNGGTCEWCDMVSIVFHKPTVTYFSETHCRIISCSYLKVRLLDLKNSIITLHNHFQSYLG